MAGEELPLVAEAEGGVEESPTEATESEASSNDTSTITRTSEYAKGSSKLKGALLNALLIIFVVGALIAHVQLGRSELSQPSKPGELTPPSHDVSKPEEPKPGQEAPAEGSSLPELPADEEEDLSESEEELEEVSDDDDVPASPEVQGSKDPRHTAEVAALEDNQPGKQEVRLPESGPQAEPADASGEAEPSWGVSPSPVQEAQGQVEVVHTPETGAQEESDSEEEFEDALPADSGGFPVLEGTLPQQQAPVAPVAQDESEEEPKDDMAQQEAGQLGGAAEQSDVKPPATVEEKPEESAVPTLLSCLAEPMFEKPFSLSADDLAPYVGILRGPPEDLVTVQGFYVPRRMLVDFLTGEWLDVTMLQIYTNMVTEHIDERVARGLQPAVALLNPSEISIAWQLFATDNRVQEVNPESVKRALVADRVVFAMSAPLRELDGSTGKSHTGHFIVGVIDRKEHRVSVVDSLPRQPSFYEPILEFMKEIARQLHDPDDGPPPPYEASPHVPEPGFPMQVEALKGANIPLSRGLTNACGAFSMENVICIAEGRRPNYGMADAQRVRIRLLLEIMGGLWDRPLTNGELREAYGGLEE